MHYLSRLRLPMLALAAILATMVRANASAQTIGGPGGTCRSFGGGGSVTCSVDATSSLTNYPLFVWLTSPATAPSQCNGRTRSGYSTTGSVATVVSLGSVSGCEFVATTGTAPAGSSVGDIVFSGVTATTLDFGTALCLDPSCSATPPVVPATATVSTGGNGYFGNGNYCNGYGSNGYGSGYGNSYGSGYGSNGYGGPGRFGCGQQGYGCQYGQYTPGQPCYGGGYSCTGQYCPGSGYTLCNGVEIPAGSYCSPSTPYTYCNGVQVPAGSYCNTTNGYTTCPDGQQVPAGSLCTSVTGSAVSYPPRLEPGRRPPRHGDHRHHGCSLLPAAWIQFVPNAARGNRPTAGRRLLGLFRGRDDGDTSDGQQRQRHHQCAGRSVHHDRESQ